MFEPICFFLLKWTKLSRSLDLFWYTLRLKGSEVSCHVFYFVFRFSAESVWKVQRRYTKVFKKLIKVKMKIKRIYPKEKYWNATLSCSNFRNSVPVLTLDATFGSNRILLIRIDLWNLFWLMFERVWFFFVTNEQNWVDP